MKKLGTIYLLIPFLIIGCANQDDSNVTENNASTTKGSEYTPDAVMQSYFDNRVEGEQVFIEAKIIKILPDDNDGSRHQRFIVELNSGQSILIAHNIDLAPRIEDLTIGGTMMIYGQYEWNLNGGIIHWTHNDPTEIHVGGWIEYRGDLFE